MASINSRSGKLYIDFRYKGIRCREQTLLADSQVNERKLNRLLKQIDADIRLGCFVYSEYFPDSPRAKKFVKDDIAAQQKKEAMLGSYKSASQEIQGISTIPFSEFAVEWYHENEVRWKDSYKDSMKIYLHNYLIPEFGEVEVDKITRPDILKYRARLMQPKDGKQLSADFVNHVMTPLRMILNEAADRYGFRSSFENIKQLRIEKRDVHPFSLQEVMTFIDAVREEYRNYFIVRFFTGMRTSEIDGLKWKFVDFDLEKICIRETYVHRRTQTVKTIGSARDIDMSSMVLKALREQYEVTGRGEYVFTNAQGNPVDKTNLRERIWKPTLEAIGMDYRRPYETRHTAATLWLAAGEAPEWIAKQMGHTTTKMLFEIYSRFVPNLTRQDGSAFEKLLSKAQDEHKGGQA